MPKPMKLLQSFLDEPSITIADLVETLNKISPMNASKWSQIKY